MPNDLELPAPIKAELRAVNARRVAEFPGPNPQSQFLARAADETAGCGSCLEARHLVGAQARGDGRSRRDAAAFAATGLR
jgi:hypothetical protein